MRYFFLLLSFLVLASCGKDKEGDLQMTFKGLYDNETLVMATALDYRADYPLRIDKSSFFLTSIFVVNSEGEEIELAEVELVDLSYFDLNDALEGMSFDYEDLPAGSYEIICFTIGVNAGLNAMEPQDFPSTNPLSESGNYWLSWNSYIFSKLEGATDTLQNGSFDQKFAYHTGSDALSRSIYWDYDFQIEDDEATNLIFIVDHKELLQEGSDYLDIKNIPSNHTPDDLENMEKIMDNFVIAVKLQG